MAKAATATSAARTHPTSAGVPENNRQALIALLNARLADGTGLRSQVKWAHSNLKGLHFIQLHELFDSASSHLDDQSDTIAERAATLGGVANGAVREAAEKSGLEEADLTASDGPSMLSFLVHNVAHHSSALGTAVQSLTISVTLFLPISLLNLPASLIRTFGASKLISLSLEPAIAELWRRGLPCLFLFVAPGFPAFPHGLAICSPTARGLQSSWRGPHVRSTRHRRSCVQLSPHRWNRQVPQLSGNGPRTRRFRR